MDFPRLHEAVGPSAAPAISVQILSARLSGDARYERKISPAIHRRTRRSGGSATPKWKQHSIRRMCH